MILVGKKGKNTVQALVIFRNFIDGEGSNVNQTNNDIKNARGVDGSNARICGAKPRSGPTLYAKSGGS